MEKPKRYITNYIRKNSWFKILSDFLFYLFILLMIIPGTRRPLTELIIRTTMIRPKVETENIIEVIGAEDNKLVIEDLGGKTFNIGDFKGNVILINFWATWCPPCRAEMPSFQMLYNDYSDKISFLFIADDNLDKIRNFMSEFNYKLPVYILRSPPTQTFSIHSIPTSFLINKKGEVLVHKKGAANWNSKNFRDHLDILIGEK